MERIWSIQYLRGLAAASVVIFHALESTQHRFEVGAAGVDIFFIISGFIMTSLMLRPEVSAGSFMWRRLTRIAPLYWCATLAVPIVCWIKPTFFYEFDGSLENIVLSLLFLPHSSQTGGVAPVIQQGWTLEIEMFFYLLCVLALLTPAPHRPRRLAGSLLGLVALSAIVPVNNDFIRAYTNPLLLEFCAGIGLAVAWKERVMLPPTVGMAALVIGFACFGAEQTGFLRTTGLRVIDWGFPALLIVAGAISLEAAGRIPKSRLGLLSGDSSYSLYLTHGFVVAALQWEMSWAPVWLRVALTLVGACGLAVASYLFFERPVAALLKRFSSNLTNGVARKSLRQL